MNNEIWVNALWAVLTFLFCINNIMLAKQYANNDCPNWARFFMFMAGLQFSLCIIFIMWVICQICG